MRAAFTLVEMLVVIAITVILFALLLRPLVESLRLTSSAQIQAAAQDSARITLERITRELGSAVYVYDNNSHPFQFAAPAGGFVAGNRYDKSTNFLDLSLTKSDGTAVVEHAYNAKLDLVPARHADNGGLMDPTAPGDPIQVKGGKFGSGVVSSTGLLFPLAPGSYISRYFVGLKNPTLPYTNSSEGLLAAASSTGDNTYILYEAQVSAYNRPNAPKNADGTTINEKLFAPMRDAAGNAINQPELDDPDFFRYVNQNGATDVNWLDKAHAAYPTQTSVADGTPAGHNQRVDEWYKIAKPVITAPDIDLILLPHNSDGSIHYDTAADTNPILTVSHSGASYDAVTGTEYPIVNTSVTFQPAVIAGDAAPGTTADYSSLGIPANAVDNGGLPYVPTLYTASNQSLVDPPLITLAPNTGNGIATKVSYWTTDAYAGATTTVMGAAVNPGDLVEYYHAGGAMNGTAVYDVTTGVVLTGGDGKFVPLSVNANTGTINFDTPALPAPPDQNSPVTYNPYQRYWSADPAALNNGLLQASPADPNAAGGHDNGVIDLTQLFCDGNGALTQTGGSNTSPLSRLGLAPGNGTTTAGPLATANAFVVPGSLRVYGPDATPGPGLGSRVLYTPVGPGTPLSFNEYRIDYLSSLLTFYVDGSNQLPMLKADNSTPADPVQIAFNYQANLAPPDPTAVISATGNSASPMLVKIDYQTRDLLDVNIGVRVYDSSQSRSVVVPVHNRVQIGNSNR